MVKKVSVLDGSSVYQKIPGNAGSLTVDGKSVDDSVHGQNFKSELVTIKSWGIDTPAFYKGIPGYKAKIKKGGTPTTLTDEATTLVSGKTYKITDTAKQLLDIATAVVIKDNAVTVDADDILDINYLWGRVTFVSGYSVVGAVTISGKYVPLATLGFGKNIALSMTCNIRSIAEFDNTQASSGFENRAAGLNSVGLTIDGIYSDSNSFWLDIAETTVVLEVDPGGDGLSKARGFFRLMSNSRSGNVGDNEDEKLVYTLSVPNEELLKYPFGWIHESTSTLDASIQLCLNNWESGSQTTVKYESQTSGIGVYGASIIEDISLATDVEGQTEFSIKFAGTDNLLEL